MESKIYNQEGKEAGKLTLPESVFGVKWNSDLVHQVVVSMQSNARTPVAHTKNRGDVRGGGKKPWKQKGTGRARHGSTRSPIWIGGGVTHGPRNEKDYSKKINKKMKSRALFAVLSKKYNDNEILFVDSLAFGEKKTAVAKKTLQAFSKISGFEGIAAKKRNSALVTTFGKNENTWRSFNNFGNIAVEDTKNLNPVDILNYKYLVISDPKESIAFLSGKGKERTKLKNQNACPPPPNRPQGQTGDGRREK